VKEEAAVEMLVSVDEKEDPGNVMVEVEEVLQGRLLDLAPCLVMAVFRR
jgi:hypothetical protein